MKVYVLYSEYPQEGSARIEGVYASEKLVNHIFDLLEGDTTGRKYAWEAHDVFDFEEDNP